MKLDRSRIDTRLGCEMRRYFEYHYDGVGIVPAVYPLDAGDLGEATDFGTVLHRELAVILGQPFSPTPPLNLSEESMLFAGWLANAWQQVRWPLINENYRVYRVEEPFSVHYGGFEWRFRYDAVLIAKDDSHSLIPDFKSLSGNVYEWEKQMSTSLQTILYHWAFDKHYSDLPPLAGVQYEGIIKGRRQFDTTTKKEYYDNKLMWPYDHNGNPTLVYAKGRPRKFIYDFGFNVPEDWWAKCVSEGFIDSLLTTALPVPPPPHVRNMVVDQIVESELYFHQRLGGGQELMARNPNHCFKYGTKYPCPFHGVCWHDHPIEGFMPREDHHKKEPDDEV